MVSGSPAAFVLVRVVFRSPAVDYRLVVAGALLPLVELPSGHPGVAQPHRGGGAAGPAGADAPPAFVQRRLVAIPIGVFLHLLLDGVWADTDAFWWPFTGVA